jgi:hypothetical protein
MQADAGSLLPFQLKSELWQVLINQALANNKRFVADG